MKVASYKIIKNILISENIPEEQNANQDDQVQVNLHNTQSISLLGSVNNLPVERRSACFALKVEGIVCSNISQPGNNVHRNAIPGKLPPPADQEWMLETTLKIILKNRNFCAPGPNRLVHF